MNQVFSHPENLCHRWTCAGKPSEPFPFFSFLSEIVHLLVKIDRERFSANTGEFLDIMARTFTAANDSSISEMNRTQNMPARIKFTDSGFKPQFQNGSNQVRHFVAGFVAGAIDPTLGIYARSQMNARENPNNPLDQKDINLNGISTEFGATYVQSASGIDFTRRYLARAIRKVVCQ